MNVPYNICQQPMLLLQSCHYTQRISHVAAAATATTPVGMHMANRFDTGNPARCEGMYKQNKAIQGLWPAQRQNAWSHLQQTDLFSKQQNSFCCRPSLLLRSSTSHLGAFTRAYGGNLSRLRVPNNREVKDFSVS